MNEFGMRQWRVRWTTLAALMALSAVWTGCGRGGGDGDGAALPEIRGEPIRAVASVPIPQAGGVGMESEPEAAEWTDGDLTGEIMVAAPGTPPVNDVPAPVLEEVTELTLAGAALVDSAIEVPREGKGSETVAAARARQERGTREKPLVVGFDELASFEYDLPDGPVEVEPVAAGKASAQIPEGIQALNEQFVSLKGFMLPLKVEKGLVTELLIMRDQSMCCYGTVPRINEWVSVKMVGQGVKPIMDQAVVLHGTLKVGEMYENGYLVGIYEMAGDRMTGPMDM
ncbi:MAG: DUF3299 domain-containing protein [Verrucomicrobiae bacterium]|nr:DUF3299 domain-containing protein [Verrucomicrobiae bacterium]